MQKLLVLLVAISIQCFGATELLIQFRDGKIPAGFTERFGGQLSQVSAESGAYKWQSEIGAKEFEIADDPAVQTVQPNYPIYLLANPSLEANRFLLQEIFGQAEFSDGPAYPDNPAIKSPEQSTSGEDPLMSQSWGLFQIGIAHAWQKLQQGKGVIVAITDTGVDYNHEDLIQNMWRNPGEIADDNVDNDNNGYVDDVVGWDFSSQDKFPYDLSMSIGDILFKGGNPGHGTHVAGVVASQLKNSKGTAGVAPKTSLMALRFINESGQGETAGAISAIDYAVANGARIINASWGSEGEEQGDTLLREAIARAEAKGVLFVAAAGNGRVNAQTFESAGYNNDTDPKPMYPATYPHSNIVAVAAVSNVDALTAFSNFGKKSVDLAAPGVKILSTVPGNRYQDTLIDVGQLKVTWDGTSMATPFVSGALAAIWSSHKRWEPTQVIQSVLESAKPCPALTDKVATGGRLELGNL